GYDPDDPSSSNEPVDQEVLRSTLRMTEGPRLGVVVDYLDRAEPGVRDNVQAMAGQLQQAGAKLLELRLPMEFELVSAVHDVIMHVEASAVHRQLIEKKHAGYAPLLRQTIEAGRLIPAVSYVQAQRLRRRFRACMEPLLDQVDALL